MKRNIICISFLLSLCFSLLIGTAQLSRDMALTGEVVRLHVIAASDTYHDQRIKLLVRDAVLSQIDAMGLQSSEQAVARMKDSLMDLAICAQQVLRREGMEQSVQVRLCTEVYPMREYGEFALPSGEYMSLQIRIGSAQGHNWWCVVYPNLCYAADGGEFVQVAQAAGLTDAQIRLMTVDTSQIQFRFKLLELIQKLRSVF